MTGLSKLITRVTGHQPLDDAVARVVASGNCSGCGACTLLDPGLTMAPTAAGYLRPTRRPGSPANPAGLSRRRFAAVCPGVQLTAGRTVGDARRHPTLGPIAGIWEAWATDEQIRHAGSSGGVLTALGAYLVQTGTAHQVLGATASTADARRTVPLTITTREEALAASGSRYAPFAALDRADALDPGCAVVGKPCEASALRALTDLTRTPAPLILSFFCAGTPSQVATTTLLDRLGMPDGARVTSLRYRGQGWPGDFTATSEDGHTVSTTYDDSWGTALGPTVQWRCKICPDGVGESADVAAGDFWRTDTRGYPSFTDAPGISVVIARTPRGLALVQEAAHAGVIRIEPISPDDVAAVQPLQTSRRITLLGRLIGARLAGRPVPRYHGFGLTRLALSGARPTIRAGRGTYRRIRAGGSAGVGGAGQVGGAAVAGGAGQVGGSGQVGGR